MSEDLNVHLPEHLADHVRRTGDPEGYIASALQRDEQRVAADYDVLEQLWGKGWDESIPSDVRDDVSRMLGHGQYAA
jgi:hypothetical protein